MNKTRCGWRASLVMLLAVGMVAAACGKDTDDSNASPSGGGSGATPAKSVQGIDGTTIKVGGLIDGTTMAGAETGFEARIARANTDKELGKYTIDYVGSDDVGSSVDKSMSATQSKIDRDKVFALAPVQTTGWDTTASNYAADKGVPAFGSGFSKGFCEEGSNYSILGCYTSPKFGYTTPMQGVAETLGKDPSDLKWAFMTIATPEGEHTVQSYTKLVESIGGEVVYSEAVIPQNAGSDLSPFVSAVMDTKPDVIWVLAASQAIGVVSALKTAGYKGSLVNSAFYGPGMLKTPGLAAALEGSIVTTLTPVMESNSPRSKQMIADYEAAGHGQSDITFGGMFGWWIADLMVEAMKKVAPNFADLVPTVNKGFDYEPEKDGNPISFPAGFTEGVKCVTILKVEAGAYEIVDPFRCDGKRVPMG